MTTAENDIASMNGIITQARANGWDVGQALYKMGYRLDPYPNGKSKDELIDMVAREQHKLDKARILLHEITMKKAAMACLPEHLALNVERFLAESSLVPSDELNDGMTQNEMKLEAEDVRWIVNDIAELGVEIHGQCFFLYKGESLVYKNGHDDGSPMLIREVGKREFGEVVYPMHFSGLKPNEKYSVELVWTPGLSFGPKDNPRYQWHPIFNPLKVDDHDEVNRV